MTKNEILAETSAIQTRFYHQMMWLAGKCQALIICIIFLIYGYRTEDVEMIVISFISTGVCMYLVMLSLGLDLSLDDRESPWTLRKESLERLQHNC